MISSVGKNRELTRRPIMNENLKGAHHVAPQNGAPAVTITNQKYGFLVYILTRRTAYYLATP